ncbi:activating transcription factor 7-interacting protein 2 isoform X2 [Xenopus laevis]|uniref:Activating transcription factor 7-interacting protein 2 isoform X2 n=1 Tax=Xenopus laevis TaxID=8355 RepID=A0A8J0TVE0_XENLA|nr:activating transcription factor 7-interacting protein 2 isoform X2 [Xenopus laevis]
MFMNLATEAPEVKMANCTNTSVKKIFRAKKTMSASCRRQMAFINNLKNCTKEGITAEGLTTLLSTDRVQQSDKSSKTNCPEKTDSKLSKSLEPLNQNLFSNELKVSIALSQVDFRVNTGGSYEEAFSPSGASDKNHDHFSSSTVAAGASYGFTEQKADTSCPEKAFAAKQPLQSSPVSKELQQVTCFSERITEHGVSKNDQTQNSEIVRPPHIKDKVVVKKKTKGASQRKRVHSGSSDVSCCKRTKASTNGCSEPEKINVTLEKIQCLIENRIQSFFKDSFDQRMEDLSRRVSLIKCMGNQGNVIAQYLRKARKLERRIKSVLSVQKEAAKQRSKSNYIKNAKKEEVTTDNAKVASDQKLPSMEASIPSPKKVFATDSLAKISNISNTNDRQKTETDHNKSTKKENSSLFSDSVLHSSAISDTLVSAQETICQTECCRKNSIIDLTEDEAEDCKEAPDIKLEEHHSCSDQNIAALSGAVQKPLENKSSGICIEAEVPELIPMPLHMQCKKTKTGSIKSEDQHCNEAPEQMSVDKCPVTPDTSETLYSNKALGCRESEVAKSITSPSHVQATSPNCDSGPEKLQPPQKPELRLTQVQNPKGIALSWTVSKIDPNCAPAESYCLYVHKVDPSVEKILWKKIGEIKALPLPMGCTLTQFEDGSTYIFTLRAKDSYGRFGPLCDIQSVTLLPSVKAPNGLLF